jgi:hypothetical protein
VTFEATDPHTSIGRIREAGILPRAGQLARLAQREAADSNQSPSSMRWPLARSHSLGVSWAASYARTLCAAIDFRGGLYMSVEAGEGVVHVAWSTTGGLPPVERTQVGFFVRPRHYIINPRTFWEARGFARYIGNGNYSVYFPYWFAMLLVGVGPTLMLWRQRRRRRHRRRLGLCLDCGYDTRATPGRCPECGQAAPHAGTRPGAVPVPTELVR